MVKTPPASEGVCVGGCVSPPASEGEGVCIRPPASEGVCMCMLSCVQLFATPGTVALQASLSMEFSRQEYWSGLPFSPPGDPPNPEIKPGFPAFQADSLQLHHGNSLASEGYTGSMPGPGGLHMPQGS